MASITNETWAQGTVLREPPGRESGYWAGAPGAFFDADTNVWYLTYRLRRPRGIAPDRGGEVRIARSENLRDWQDIVTIGKDRYASASIERSCLHRGPDGFWRYFTSYVHPADGRWCTAVIKARRPEELRAEDRQVIFTGPPLQLEGVKDPWLLEDRGVYHLFLSVATPVPATHDGSHATLDIFNTGECKSATALATSRDLEHWEWQGLVLTPPATGWDRYCRRLNTAVRFTTAQAPYFVGFFDGSGSHHENYEERCAIAVSRDLRSWQSRSPDGPAFTSPFASQSLRYVDAHWANHRWHLFYEFARSDGAHDLRLITCTAGELEATLPRPQEA